MLLAFGMLTVLLGRFLGRHGFEIPRALLVVAVVAAWVSTVNSMLFFPTPPVAMLLIAALCFSTALVLTPRHTSAAV